MRAWAPFKVIHHIELSKDHFQSEDEDSHNMFSEMKYKRTLTNVDKIKLTFKVQRIYSGTTYW